MLNYYVEDKGNYRLERVCIFVVYVFTIVGNKVYFVFDDIIKN